jgi:hypothetical protein
MKEVYILADIFFLMAVFALLVTGPKLVSKYLWDMNIWQRIATVMATVCILNLLFPIVFAALDWLSLQVGIKFLLLVCVAQIAATVLIVAISIVCARWSRETVSAAVFFSAFWILALVSSVIIRFTCGDLRVML